MLGVNFWIDNCLYTVCFKCRNCRNSIRSVTELIRNFELSTHQFTVFSVFTSLLDCIIEVLTFIFWIKHFANWIILNHASIHTVQICLFFFFDRGMWGKLDTSLIFSFLFFLTASASKLAHLVLKLDLLFCFLLLLYFLHFVVIEHYFDFLFLKEANILKKNIEMHLDDLRLSHKFDVRNLFLGHFSWVILAKEGVSTFSELLNFF